MMLSVHHLPISFLLFFCSIQKCLYASSQHEEIKIKQTGVLVFCKNNVHELPLMLGLLILSAGSVQFVWNPWIRLMLQNIMTKM